MITVTSNVWNVFDWLRVLAILVVFLYHSARFLDDWNIKNVRAFVCL
jgi:hypothetical protein